MVVCDKCKKQLNHKEKRASWHIVLQTDDYKTFNEVDLCPQCIVELTKFLTDKEG